MWSKKNHQPFSSCWQSMVLSSRSPPKWQMQVILCSGKETLSNYLFALATLGGGDQGLWILASSESHLYNFGALEKKLHQCLFSTSGATCAQSTEAIQWRHLGSVVRSARYRPLVSSATYIRKRNLDNVGFGSSTWSTPISYLTEANAGFVETIYATNSCQKWILDLAEVSFVTQIN